MAENTTGTPSFARRGTLAFGQLGQAARLDAGYGTVEAPEAAGDSLSPSSKRRMLDRRQTFTEGEIQHPSKYQTWTIEQDEDTMSDSSLVINMLCDISPAGVLPLAFGMSGTGYIPSVLLLLVFASAAAYMMFLVARTIEIAGVKSYDRLWERCIGSDSKWMPTVVLWLVCFGNALAYICMVGDLISMCLPGFGINFLPRSYCIAVLAMFPLLPLCMLKDLSALAPTSFLALIAVVYMAIMMVIRFMDGSYLPGGEFHGFPRPKGHIGNFGIASLLLVNNLSIAFLCHYNGCKYYREFVDHRPGKFGVRVFTAFMLASCLFAITMLLGYATFGPNCEGVILNNYAKNDMLANIARFGMGFANVFSLPLMFSGLREATLVLLATANPGNAVFDQVWFQNALSAFMLGVIAILGIMVTDVSTVIGLVGAICGSAIIYVIPCLLFDRASAKFMGLGDYDHANPYERVLVQTIGCIGVVLMFAGSMASILM